MNMANVTSWGTGRKDWSQNVEAIVVPLIKSHQGRQLLTDTSDWSPYDFMTIDDEGVYGTNGLGPLTDDYIRLKLNFITFYANATFDANVLIKAYFSLYNFNTGEVVRLQEKWGFARVQFDFPKGFVLTLDQMKAGWTVLIEFLPGGYITSITMSAMIDRFVG